MELHSEILEQSFYLRGLHVSDASLTYLSWLNDPEINQFLEVRLNPPRTLTDLKTFIRSCAENQHTLLLGIFLLDADVHIGNVKFGQINSNHKTADLGFLIGDKALWGKRYASRAIKLASNFGFKNLGLEKITAGAAAENIGSQKALVNAGFALEGVLRSQSIIGRARQDGYLYGILKADDYEKD